MIYSYFLSNRPRRSISESFLITLSIVVVSLVLFSTSIATNWSLIGPDDDVTVYNYQTSELGQYMEVLCTSNGITLGQDFQWSDYSLDGLPVKDVSDISNDTLLLILGDGTDSDGIYKFSLTDHQFHLVELAPHPKFIHEHYGTFYVGTSESLLRSGNTNEWESVEYFEGSICSEMESYNNNLFVSSYYFVLDGTHYSHDNGETWTLFPGGAPSFSDMEYDNDGTLYGIRPFWYISSGMFYTSDSGLTWDVVFRSLYMTSLVMVHGNRQNFFVSWKSEDEIERGVARYDRHNDQFLFMNDGLPCHSVNKLSYNNHIDYDNVVACTDSGAYITVDLPELFVLEDHVLPAKFSIETYPNPFNSSVAIKIDIPSTADLKLRVYNLLGKQVAPIAEGQYNPGFQTFHWNANGFTSGIYFINANSPGKFDETHKVLLIR